MPGSCERDMTVCFIFVLSLNISLPNETYSFIKPAFFNPMSEGVLCKLPHYRTVSVAYIISGSVL